MTDATAKCIYCDADSMQAPLLAIKYQDQDYWICVPHLPILIHEPRKLAGKLPGAEKMTGHSHD